MLEDMKEMCPVLHCCREPTARFWSAMWRRLRNLEGSGYSLVEEHLAGMCQALGCVPSTEEIRNKTMFKKSLGGLGS